MHQGRLPLLLIAAVGGCGAAAEPTGSSTHALEAPNGVHLNGVHLNGVHLNGVHLNGSLLVGVGDDGAVVSGEGFVGTELVGQLDSGDALPLRIESVSFADNDERDPVSYVISYKAAEEAWQPLCADAEGVPLAAIAVPGVWSHEEGVPGGGAHTDSDTLFTFACVNGAIAKCIDFGYKPWGTVDLCDERSCWPISLAPYHQACTRLLRADYCGDGRSHTSDGRRVNLYDDVGVQSDTRRWSFEAEWSADGAVCMSDRRDLEDAVPSCMSGLTRASCGARKHKFADGTLLLSEFRR